MKLSKVALAYVGSLASIIRPVLSDSSGISSFLRKQTTQRSLVDNEAFTLVSVNDDETVTVSVKQVEFGSSSTCGQLATDATRAWHFFSVYMDPELAEPVCDYHSDVDACFEATYTVACDPDTMQASIELFIRDETYSPSQDKVTNPKVGSCLTTHDILGKSKSWKATFDCTPPPPPDAIAPKAGPGDDCTTTEDCDVDLMCVPQQADSSYYGFGGGGGGPMPLGGPGPVRKLMTQLTRALIGAPPPGPDGFDTPDGPGGSSGLDGPSGMPPPPVVVDYNNKKCQPYLKEGNGCGIWETEPDCNPNEGLYCSTYSPHWCNGPTDMMGGTCQRDAGTCTTNADCNTASHFCHAQSSRCVPRGGNFACCHTDKQCLPGLTCAPQEDYYSPFGGPDDQTVSWCE